MDDDFSAQEFLRFFIVAWLSSLAFIVARVTGWLAKSPVQPVEPEMLREWRARGAIPRRAKYAALFGTMAGYALFWLGSSPGPLLAITVAALMLFGLAYVFSRPS